jgi:hypothetical protein
MESVTQNLGRIVNLMLVFAVAYMLAEVVAHAYGLAPGVLPLLVAGGVTLIAGGAWQWRRSSPSVRRT